MSSAAANSVVPLSWTHQVQDIGARGLDIKRSATAAECRVLEAALDVQRIDRFDVVYRIGSQNGRRYRLTGKFEVDLTQACVVTLEPVVSRLEEEFSVGFTPPEKAEVDPNIERSVLDDPDIEIYTGDTLEVGRVLFELLAAAIDPYPRSDGAEFSYRDPLDPADRTQNPFAVLAKLKKNE